MLPVARIRAALAKPLLPVVFFFAGVTYDSLTLTRIDRLVDNLVLLLYLCLLGALIVVTARGDPSKGAAAVPAGAGMVANVMARARPYYPNAMQFLLGGLFSAYAIFYSRSASLTTTAVFFGLLVVLLVGNEFLRDRLSSLRLLVSLYALVIFSFFTFFLPVLTGLMNTWVFLLGACLSAAVTVGVVRLVCGNRLARSRHEAVLTGLPALGLIVVLVGFYFLNWIPPVPLSLKFGGVYHQVSRADGRYELTFEKGAWYEFWKRSDDPFRGGGPAYCFTAVFAPFDMRATVFHRWQYRPRNGRDFATTDRIGAVIAGGREGGYRVYTVKQRLLPGDWRVDVETSNGRTIGRVSFRVDRLDAETPTFDAITY